MLYSFHEIGLPEWYWHTDLEGLSVIHIRQRMSPWLWPPSVLPLGLSRKVAPCTSVFLLCSFCCLQHPREVGWKQTTPTLFPVPTVPDSHTPVFKGESHPIHSVPGNPLWVDVPIFSFHYFSIMSTGPSVNVLSYLQLMGKHRALLDGSWVGLHSQAG